MSGRRILLLVHRWIGVAVCLPVYLWFLSGIGMMYCNFPEVTARDRLVHGQPLNMDSIRLSAADAFANARSPQNPIEIHLTAFDGRPTYRFRVAGNEIVVYADTGEVRHGASDDVMRRVASSWTRQPGRDARVEPVTGADQWTVQGALRTMRPMWKFSWADGEDVYIAGATGDVVQYTTTTSRLRAYLGPIPHWIYFTPLREHPTAWVVVIDCLSGLACASAIVGLAIGIRTRMKYRGAKKWHVVLGLVFGAATVSWTFSGLLSMGPVPALAEFNTDDMRAKLAQALRPPVNLDDFSNWSAAVATANLATRDVRDLELAMFGGEPAYIASLGDGTLKILTRDGSVHDSFDAARVMAIAQSFATRAAGVVTSVLRTYDRFYLDRRGGLPLPVVLVQIADENRTRLYVDPKTARIAGVYEDRSWANRWLYHGLHSLDFPWLYDYRPAWDIVVIVFMLGGAALSATSILLAWRVLTRRIKDAFQ